MAERRSRGLLMPVVGGLIVIVALVAGIAYRSQLWQFLKWLGGLVGDWFTTWVPDHPGGTAAIGGFAVFAFALNWIAHVNGRLRAWIFAIVVEIGVWIIFWYGIGIKPLNELVGLNITKLSSAAVATSAIAVVAVTGVVFWFLEAREEWHKYRRRQNVEG